MPTYQVRCARCGNEKWPVLRERPMRYVCALCAPQGLTRAAPLRDIEKRKIRALRGARGPT